MKHLFDLDSDDFQPPVRRLAVLSLKRCPLCGTLNARQNAECITCTWHGEFEQDAPAIESALSELLERCPELSGAFDEGRVILRRRSWWSRLMETLSNRFGRRSRIDLSV